MIATEGGSERVVVDGLKRSLARCLVAGGLTALARRRHRNRVRILLYHGVLQRVTGPAAFGNLFVTAAEFVRHMRHVKKMFHVMSLHDVIQHVDARREFPDRAVAITFDDGYRNTITAALPILEALQLPATVFVVGERAGKFLWFDALRILISACVAQGRAVDFGCGISIDGLTVKNQELIFLDRVRQIMNLAPADHQAAVERAFAACREDRLFDRHPEFVLAGWDEWRRVVGNRITVGSHGLTHNDLSRMSSEARMDDLRRSKLRIESELSEECRVVAYPYGNWDDDIAQVARMAGYACAVTADDGLNGSEGNRFALRRTMIGDKGNFWLFRARVSGLWGALRDISQRPARAAGRVTDMQSHTPLGRH